MASVRIIAKDELFRILNLQEDAYLDLKSAEITPSKLSKSVSAFANTAGGELFVGIGEETGGPKNRSWLGFKDLEAANGFFQVFEKMRPGGGFYHAEFFQCEACVGYVLHLTVFKTKEILYATDGVPYIRRNAQCLGVTDKDGFKRLELDKGISSHEDVTLNIPVSEVTNSTTILSFIIDVVPSAEPETWLSKQNLLEAGKPTVAGVMLFSDEPQAALPKHSAIKIYRYKTKSEEGSRDTLAFTPITIEGSLYKLIYDAVSKTKEIIEDISIMTDRGLEKIKYPDETLHEIITNAVLHRDYSIASDVHVRIYDNRVEVESPGRLPGHITTDNILKEQSARNPKMVRLINKFPNPPNKDVGEGLNTAFEAMKKLRLREPEIEEGENTITVHIRHAPLASPHDLIIEYLKTHDEISNKVARELTGIGSENAVKRIFLELKKTKVLQPVPGRRGSASAWQIYTPPVAISKEIAADLFANAGVDLKK